MFIELTDHLRCPSDHEERFLVLLPERMEGRRVVAGSLGCPVCRRVVLLESGSVEFGPAPAPGPASALSAEAARALIGIDGPGGFVALVAEASSLAADLGALLPGVRFALVNPPPGTADTEWASVVRSPRLPLKESSVRAAVLGPSAGSDPRWVEAGLRAVLPGNRAVVEGPVLELPGFELLAEAGGVWVARKLSRPAAGASGRP